MTQAESALQRLKDLKDATADEFQKTKDSTTGVIAASLATVWAAITAGHHDALLDAMTSVSRSSIATINAVLRKN